MDKANLKSAAMDMRERLLRGVEDLARLVGVSDEGIRPPLPQSSPDIQFFDIGTQQPHQLKGKTKIEQRRRLAEAVRRRGYANVMEEVAYTWFNRLIALRFMELNGYLPLRALSSASGKAEPDLVTRPYEAGLAFTQAEQEDIRQCKEENRPEDLYRLLFMKQCNQLGETLPELFERQDDYTELLFSVSYIREGVLRRLVDGIPEEDFRVEREDGGREARGQVEIIGWLYQYYNTGPKQAVFDGLKKNIKIGKDRIPAATQLFTPDWIVRYMVENSLGRLWLESRPNVALQAKWRYYLPEARQEPAVAQRLARLRAHARNQIKKPADIKFIDPCMGSGHILVCAFDVLMDIYQSAGWHPRDAVRPILERNLFGLDIDKRAFQLAYFALMMKARQYNRRILDGSVFPQVYHPQGWPDGEEYGSLAPAGLPGPAPEAPAGPNFLAGHGDALRVWNFRRLLGQEYGCVVTNPPYAGASGLNGALTDFMKTEYPGSKSDLFACFIERCMAFTKQGGFTAMITQQAWMFLSSYEKLRNNIQGGSTIINMAHLGNGAFGVADFGLTSFVLTKEKIASYLGGYIRLIESSNPDWKEQEFLAGRYRYYTCADRFEKIPGRPVAYWASEQVFAAYRSKSVLALSKPCKGIDTGSNDLFLRLWFELNGSAFAKPGEARKKWVPYNKGGSFRKWYGNNEYVLDWSGDGSKLRQCRGSNLRNRGYYFREGITWTTVTSGNPSFRYFENGFAFDNGGCCLFAEDRLLYLQGLLNSSVALHLMKIAPTLNYQPGDVGRVPVILQNVEQVEKIVSDSIALSRADWDAFETSWDFKRHPLLNGGGTAAESFSKWQRGCGERFNTLKANEEELNRIFIDIYGLWGELAPEVEDRDVTVRRADLGRDIRSLVSYAAGCMFGRYSLDEDGLIFAGGAWSPDRYKSFRPDEDNVIPVTDEVYFDGDIVERFAEFTRAVWGERGLEENLRFIADALYPDANGTARAKIRRYFLHEFYKDHLKIYQKRPIYWLFDSGKGGGFKALVYLHRIDQDTVGRVRVDYLHRLQQKYEGEQRRALDAAAASGDSRAIAEAQKRGEKLARQLRDTKDYEMRIAHLALARTGLDLDDGVKVNYEKLQTAADGLRYEVLGRI